MGKIPWSLTLKVRLLLGSSDLMDPQNLVFPPLYPPQGKPSLKYIKVLQQPESNILSANYHENHRKRPT